MLLLLLLKGFSLNIYSPTETVFVEDFRGPHHPVGSLYRNLDGGGPLLCHPEEAEMSGGVEADWMTIGKQELGARRHLVKASSRP